MNATSYFKQIALTRLKFVLFTIVIFYGLNLPAQQETPYKNTIRYNITNPLIFGSRSNILGYERQLKNNQTFSVNIGTTSFPGLSSGATTYPELIVTRGGKDKGLNLSVDYRFYLAKLNSFKAPRGVYIGPYYSYNYFDRNNDWTLNSENYQGKVQTDLSFNIHTAGLEFGYQFVFLKRVSLDMVLFGPGIASYKLKAKLNTTLDPADEEKFYTALNNYLSDKIPGYNQVIESGDFKKHGTANTTTAGFRFMMMVGFRF